MSEDNKNDEEFKEAEKGPEDILSKSLNENDITIKEIKENISKNSIEIADLKNLTESIDYGNNIPSNHTDDSNVSTPRRIRYIYANVFIRSDDACLTDIKRYRFQKCLWKLKYNRIVSSFISII